MASFTPKRKYESIILSTPPSKEERRPKKHQNSYPSPPPSHRRHGGPGAKEIDFAKKMQGHPNEIKTQFVRTNLPKTSLGKKNNSQTESEARRLKAIEKKNAKDKEANLKLLMDSIVNSLPSDELMAVAPNLLWDGGDDMTKYYEWLLEEFYDGNMPEIVRRANAFRGFPQIDDEDFNQEGAAERRAYYQSHQGREELRPYLPAIKKYASKGEYVLIEARVNGQKASDALVAAAAAAAECEPKSKPRRQKSITLTSPGSETVYYEELWSATPTPTPAAAASSTLAAEDFSPHFDRSATLGHSPPLRTGCSSPEFVSPNSNTQILGANLSPGLVEMFKEEDKQMIAAYISMPSVSTPAPTPLAKQATKATRKRKDLYNSTWKPSAAGDMSSSSDDDKPLIKRTKQRHHAVAHR
ncbi:hypothetical protein PG994_006739 [Apiospora phragmitis]|uniref:Uncharacterized protein n=1 Tax=Apiospora phragmitis TaxID=2905665 RepID=A0ABR1VFW3_9PEZI